MSVIIPVLNEASCIEECLRRLQALRQGGQEVIVVDGGSSDGTPARARGLADAWLQSAPGRARQMNRGAAAARGDVLLFLHADTQLPEGADRLILDRVGEAWPWGRFDVRLSGVHPAFRVIEFLMNLRSRLTGIATGDQAIFVTRPLFHELGGYLALELMEDVELCTRLKRIAQPLCLRERVLTSSRRWERRGIARTIVRMGWLRLRYALGASPAALARDYD